MSRELKIPYRSLDDPISEVGLDAAHLEDDEHVVITRQLALNALVNTDCRTVADLIRMVEEAGPDQRRAILNRCRVDAGLDTVEDAEAHARYAAVNRESPPPPPMQCAICGAEPVTRFGYPDPNVPRVRRWLCPAHEDLAEPGDLDRHRGRVEIAEHGAVSIDRGGEIDRRDLIVSLAPGLHEGNGIAWDSGAADFGTWPPMYSTLSLDAEGDRGQVSKMVRLLGLTAAEYDDVIAQTRQLLDGAALQRWIGRTASRLAREGHLTGEEIEGLRPTNTTKEMTTA